jgi:DNA-binding CsgD family transcriptional regulator
MSRPATKSRKSGRRGSEGPAPGHGDTVLALLETLPCGLLLIRAGGAISFANARARADLGLARCGGTLAAAGGPGGALADIIDLASAARARPHRQQVTLRPGRTLRTSTWLPVPAHAVVLLRDEALRAADVERALAPLGIDPSYARLAARVYGGWSNDEIARELHVPRGRVKWRVAHLLRRLGVRRRAALVWAIDRLLDAVTGGPAARPPVGDGHRVVDPDETPPGSTAAPALAVLRGFLAEVDIGFAALDGRGALVWANAAAERLLCAGASPPAAPASAELARAAARVAGGLPGAVSTVRLDARGSVLFATLWRARAGLAGVELHCEQLREDDAIALLGVRFGLTPHEARAALLLGRGASLEEAAVAIGVSTGTMRSLSRIVYEKAGVHTRVALAGLLLDLGAGLRAPEGA